MAEPLHETEHPIGGGGGMIRPDPARPTIRPISREPAPIPVSAEPEAPSPAPSSKIRSFEQKLGVTHTDNWKRSPNATGTGAIHVKSFHCKLTGDSLSFLDQQINEWLDANPEYEVKLVTTTVGLWTGKLAEPNLIVSVWV